MSSNTNKNSDRKESTMRLHREKTSKKDYDKFLDEYGPLSKNDNNLVLRDIFMIAMAYGYRAKSKTPISLKEGFINDVNFGETLRSLIYSLAITNENDVEILTEKSSIIYDTAEQYANAGLELLKSDYFGNEDEFIEKLRLKIIKLNKDDRIINKLKELDI